MVAGSKLSFTYFEVKILAVLLQIYARDFVHYFIRNYFRFFEDIFEIWLLNFEIKPFL